jgi:glutamate/leucine/phenylalanine/valine dehydrogenase
MKSSRASTTRFFAVTPRRPSFTKEVKFVERGRVADYADRRGGAAFAAGGNIREVPCQVAVPAATQNELTGRDVGANIAGFLRISRAMVSLGLI